MYHVLVLAALLPDLQVRAVTLMRLHHQSLHESPAEQPERPWNGTVAGRKPTGVGEQAPTSAPSRRVAFAPPSPELVTVDPVMPVTVGVGDGNPGILAGPPTPLTISTGPWISDAWGSGWVSRVRQWQHIPSGEAAWGIKTFFQSAVRFEWFLFVLACVCFLALHVYLFDWPSRRTYHALALFIWFIAAGIYNWVIWYRLGPKAGVKWLVGYVLELVFSMENVFIYHIVVEAFQVPRKPAQKALFVVICCQTAFQMVFFMGLANWLRSLRALPYILGSWLIYVGVQSAREGSHEGFNARESFIFRACSWVLGGRLLPMYRDSSVVFFEKDGRIRVTLLLPAIACLLLVDFIMEVDVTLTKINEIRNHYVGFTSSVAAAFAVPELFFVARDMFKRFYLLKYGISFVLLFFGAELLLHNVVHIPDAVGIAAIAVVMIVCVVLSKLLGFQPRNDEMTDESEAEYQAAKFEAKIQNDSHQDPADAEDSPKHPVFPSPRSAWQTPSNNCSPKVDG